MAGPSSHPALTVAATIIPLYLLPESDLEPQNLVPPELLPQASALPQLLPECPIAGPASMADLLRFAALMAVEGLPTQAARMLYDRHYAFDRLAEAHACEGRTLRALAEDLFDRYQRAGEWIDLVH